MAHRIGKQDTVGISIDKSESGFPIFQELMQMASDATQAKKHLKSLPSQERLKKDMKDMINHILTEKSSPTQLQYAMSQRIYYEYLAQENLFLTQNHPQLVWVGKDMNSGRRSYLVHWAAYDSQTNLPAVYLMELEDTASRALVHDERRWPQVQTHLMAQAVSGLKLLTIAKGFDSDFDTLHPKLLRRFHLGPMYSHNFTEQRGPLRDVLSQASGEAGRRAFSKNRNAKSLNSTGQLAARKAAQRIRSVRSLDGFDHTPRLAKKQDVAKAATTERSPGIGTRRRFRSTTPGLVTQKCR